MTCLSSSCCCVKNGYFQLSTDIRTAMPRGITIDRAEQQAVVSPDGVEGFRVVLFAHDATNMPNEIFLFRRDMIDPETQLQDDTFIQVCSPYDLSKYPANAPDWTISPPFFRKHSVDVVIPSQRDAARFWQTISERVQSLIDQLNLMDELAPAISQRFGD